jgi:hypothetical protein|nr:MAG TPA: hypothetical protein [Caudoviricetes sp.]
MAKEYFCAYHSYLKSIRNLSDAECGRLFKALLQYSAGEQLINLQGREGIAFDFICEQIDRDNEKYAERCRTNRENGTKANATECRQSVPNGTERPRTVPNAPQGKGEGKGEREGNTSSGSNPPPTPPRGRVDVPEALMENWNGFCEMRKKIKKPLTDRAAKMILNELERLAPGDNHTKGLILDQSVKRCWQDVYPLKGDKSAGGTDNVFLQMLQEEGQHEPY